MAPDANASVSVSSPAIFKQMCTACHSLKGQGGQVGPALDGVGSRRTSEYLTSWLHNPSSVKPDAKMPQLPLTDENINELVKFLSQMKEGQ